MTTPLDAYLLRYNFSLTRAGNAEDIAVTGLWMDGDGTELDDAGLLSVAEGGYKAWDENMVSSRFSTAVRLVNVTGTTYLANGHTLREQVFTPADPGDQWHGTGDGPGMPWETSMCISLYAYQPGTFDTGRRRKRGRTYLPPFAANQLDPSSSGFFANSQIGLLVNEAHAWLGAAQQSAVGADIGKLSVFSRLDSQLHNVTYIVADAKIDSQRRRQNRENAGRLAVVF